MQSKKDYYIAENFKLSEFGYIKPEDNLLLILQMLRNRTGSIIITDAGRTIIQHIQEYKNLERNGKLSDRWWKSIPWSSRHLPMFERGLRAVDIKVKSDDNSRYLKGFEIQSLLIEISNELNLPIGLGIGSEFVHVDIDRIKTVIWYYSY